MWQELSTNNNKYFLNFNKNHDTYSFSMTDYVQVWELICTRDRITNILKENNPLLELGHPNFVDGTLILLFKNISPENKKFKFEVEEKENGEMKVTISIKDEDFYVKLPLMMTPTDSERFSRKVVYPVINTLCQLFRNEDRLKMLVTKKDDEIAEYVAEGAKPPLKHLRTEKFNLEKFNDMYNSNNSLLSSQNIFSVLTHLNERFSIEEKLNQNGKIDCDGIKSESEKPPIKKEDVPNKILQGIPKTEIKIEPKGIKREYVASPKLGQQKRAKNRLLNF